MRRERQSMYATLTVVGLLTILAVAVALSRAGNGDEHDAAGEGTEAVTDLHSLAPAHE